jgi:hypothetical protein
VTDIFLPVSLDVASVRFRYLDTTGASRNPYNAGVRTAARGSDKLGCSLEFTPVGGASTTQKQKRAKLTALISQLSRANRVYIYDPGYVQQGTFPATELLTNGDLSNGTTGWASGASDWSVAASNGVLRVKRVATTAQVTAFKQSAAATITQYAPYALRYFVQQGQSSVTPSHTPCYDAVASFGSTINAYGMATALAIGRSETSVSFGMTELDSTGMVAGDYFSIQYASLARCIPVDISPNGLTYSDQFDNAAWTKVNATATANTLASPDATVTADSLVENITNGVHGTMQSMTVTSAAQDLACSFCVKAGTRSWCFVLITDNSTHAVGVYVNLTTGATGTVVTFGSNVINARYFVTNMGNSWWRIDLVVRKSGSQTTMYAECDAANADGGRSYIGVAAAQALYLWRGGLYPSSAPFRVGQTTSAATTGTAQSGSGIYVKGLPVSTTGLLLEGDWVEITTSVGPQITKVISSLDSDASGEGFLQVSPPVRGTVADNAIIIVSRPTGRFIIAGDAEYMNQPGIFSTASAEFEEAPA